MRTVGDEGLELAALPEEVDAVAVVEIPEVGDRVGVEPAAEPRLIEAGRGHLDDRNLEAGVEHLAHQFFGIALPQRREQVDPEPVAHPLDPVGLELALDGAGGDADEVEPPLVRRLPYLEVKLEHPGLEPTSYGEGFFPDAVPYALAGSERVFYWRSAIHPAATAGSWELVCATTGDLGGVASLPAELPPLVEADPEGTTVVVDGTVGGDATTARVRSYPTPTVRLVSATDETVRLSADGTEFAVEAGQRRRLTLPERSVEVVGEASTRRMVAPTLALRYPGRRELHHPAPGVSYHLFPSFGLDLEDVPRPLSVPTAAGELDHDALAARLGVDLSSRPYPERVLWQALAYEAFDPHADAVPTLVQLRTGHLVHR